MIQAPVGMVDILPDAIPLWRWIESTARMVAEVHGYREIRPSMFEDTKLFIRSMGEETDVVQKEMYTFGEGEGKSITLRPEMTASVVRAYLEHNFYKKAAFQKFYYIGPLFRHERPQKGRYRQFYTFGIEAIGSYEPLLDVETIDVLVAFLEKVGLDRYTIKLNSIGCRGCRGGVRNILKSHFKLLCADLCEDCKGRLERNVFRILDCKKQSCRAVVQNAPVIYEHLCNACVVHSEKVKSCLNASGIRFVIDPYLVRGFDYYTRTVYEVTYPTLGAQDALCGGGRYDDLIADLGGPANGAVGFGIGIERVLLALEGENKKKQFDEEPLLAVYVVTIGESARERGFALLREIRSSGLSADMDYESRSIKGQMRMANKKGARFAVIVGEDELRRGEVTLKNLADGTEEAVGFGSVVRVLGERLGRYNHSS